MASGKTTFGRAAASLLGWSFVDLDEAIVEKYGTPAEIFASHGEGFFRDAETQTLAEVLEADRNTVLSLGGGTILRDENLRLLKTKARLVWLDTSYEIILSELENADRPLLHGKSPEDIRALYDARRPLYAAAADLIFPVTTTDYTKVIADLAQAIASLD